MSDWDQFLYWAKRLAAEVDLETEEREYKIEAAGRWRAAMEACRESREDWPVLIKRAAGRGNLVDRHAQTWLGNAIDSWGDALREAFVAVDASDNVTAIDEFHATLRGWGDYISPGDATTLASLVRMSHSPESFPPYRARFVTDWAHRVGEEIGQRPTERYVALLVLCDDLIRIASEHDLNVRDRLDAQGLAWTVMKYSPPVRWSPMDQAQLLAWRRGEDTATVSVARGEGVAPEVERGAWEVLGRGLRGETSAMAPDLLTWTAANARELRDRILDNPVGGGGFMDKLMTQISGASDEVTVLLAELLYLRNAPLSDMLPATKVQRVNDVLARCSTPRSLPEPLVDALQGTASFRGGQGYHAQAPAHLLWLTRFVEHWLDTPVSQRAEGLRDPFAFREIIASTPEDWPSIRYAMEYFAWPGIFPAVVSNDHRKRIHAALISDLGEPSGFDDQSITHDLVALQALHQTRSKDPGKRHHWYESPYIERWKGPVTPPKAWIVRPGEGGPALVDTWRDEGFVSLSARMLGTVEPGSSQPEVAQAVKEGYTHLDASQREATAAAYFAFLTTMGVDDIVATIDAGRLYVGVVTGEAHYVDAEGSRLRREVSWNPTATPQDDLAAPLPALLDQQGAVVEATAAYDILTALLDLEDAGDHQDEQEPAKPASTVARTPQLPAVTDEVARSLHMDREPLQEIVDLLQLRRQLVLYGPPGTGKTYVAKELAKHLVGDRSRVRLVQFHPSYSYEDFFEGFRPTLEDGQAGFKLQDGPLKSLAAEASNEENRENAYVLIIDEMNRANLAKVFGELYFLLEYRNEAVRLQYQPEKVFYLPPNLFIIGTMNTTDRSIALVDAAIRRRFPFVEMHPTEEPVKSVLGRYLAANKITDGREALLAELNRRMGDHGRDLQIGPSYLMRGDIKTDADIDRVWRYDILPLIDEHFYGQLDRAAVREMFGIEALRKALAGQSTGAGVDLASEVGPGGLEEEPAG